MQLRSHRTGVIAALATAVALSGCANVDLDNPQAWFAKPADFFGRSSGYTFSELQEAKQQHRQITANDLVDPNGGCPPPAQAQAQPGAQPNPAAAQAMPAADTASLLGGGIALGMTECDVVFRAGAPSSVQIGKAPNGDRTAVLTFNTAPRPGIYRFQAGTLMEMDRVAVPAPPPVAKKKASPSAKSTKPPKQNAQS